jgi:hypothetical protein
LKVGTPEIPVTATEMEFLNVNLIKDSSLLLHATHGPFYWQILQKNYTELRFKKPTKQENIGLVTIFPFVEGKNEGPDNSLSLRRLKFMPKKIRDYNFHLWSGTCTENIEEFVGGYAERY